MISRPSAPQMLINGETQSRPSNIEDRPSNADDGRPSAPEMMINGIHEEEEDQAADGNNGEESI